MRLHTSTYNLESGWTTQPPIAFDSTQTLLLLFASADLLKHDQQFVADLAAAFPQSHLIGCSTTTPFVNGTMLAGQAVLAVCQFEKSQVRLTRHLLDSAADSFAVGQAIGQELVQSDLRQILLFGDSRVNNANELMNGINSVAAQPVLISGGMAGHPDFTNGTRSLFLNGEVTSHAIVAAGLYGEALFVQQAEDVGLTTYSPYYEITRNTDRLIQTINGIPALEVYREFLGTLAYNKNFIHMFPIGFYETPKSPMKVVRSILDVDPRENALILASEVPAYKHMRFMTGLPSQFIEAAEKVAAAVTASAADQRPLRPMLSLTITCIGRQAAMGRHGEDEPARAFSQFLPGTQQIGFCAYGEIAWSSSGYCELHNHTINIKLLAEH
jgi:hypothetical protein